MTLSTKLYLLALIFVNFEFAYAQGVCEGEHQISRSIHCQNSNGYIYTSEIYVDQQGVECGTITNGVWGKSHLTPPPEYQTLTVGNKSLSTTVIKISYEQSHCGVTSQQTLKFDSLSGKGTLYYSGASYSTYPECRANGGGGNSYDVICEEI